MGGLMAFGTRRRCAWVPCPLSPLEGASSRKLTDYDMLSGAKDIRMAPMTRQTYAFNWMDSIEGLSLLKEMADENDGPPYYFAHPGALSNTWNVLPPHWAAPANFTAINGVVDEFRSQYALIGSKFGWVDPALVSTPDLSADIPNYTRLRAGVKIHTSVSGSPNVVDKASGGAIPFVFNDDGLASTRVSVTIVVPPNYLLTLRTAGNSSNGGRIAYGTRTSDAYGVFSGDGLIAKTAYLDPASGVKTFNVLASGSSSWRTVDLWFDYDVAYLGTDPTVTIYSMEAFLTLGANLDTTDRLWTPGRGSMPLWPTADLDISTYTVVNEQRAGATWPMTEGAIPW